MKPNSIPGACLALALPANPGLHAERSGLRGHR